jgi:hypothetical protein
MTIIKNGTFQIRRKNQQLGKEEALPKRKRMAIKRWAYKSSPG